jgi:hypothetical protein
MPNPLRILYCHCAYAQVVPPEVKQEVLAKLAEAGIAFDAVADLCEMSAKRDPALAQLAAGGPVKIAACFPRAVRGLFAAADAPLPAEGVEIRNMRTETAEQVIEALLNGQDSPPAGTTAERNVTTKARAHEEEMK